MSPALTHWLSLLESSLSSQKIQGKSTSSRSFFKALRKRLTKDDTRLKALDTHIYSLNDRRGDFFTDCADRKAQMVFVEGFVENLRVALEKMPPPAT